MNITVSVDEIVARRAQGAAHKMGKSLNQALCDYLEHLADDAREGPQWLRFDERCLSSPAKLGSWHFSRDDVNGH